MSMWNLKSRKGADSFYILLFNHSISGRVDRYVSTEWELLAGHWEHETKPLNGNNDSYGAHKTTESNNKISF